MGTSHRFAFIVFTRRFGEGRGADGNDGVADAGGLVCVLI